MGKCSKHAFLILLLVLMLMPGLEEKLLTVICEHFPVFPSGMKVRP